MSKRSRRSDNSKRQQPVQQQRAQAAQQTLSLKKGNRSGGDTPSQERSGARDTDR